METDYLTFANACQFVKRCEDDNVFIYGIERFINKNNINIPDMDGIVDFSSLSLPMISSTFSLARDFLQLYGNDTRERFKIVY